MGHQQDFVLRLKVHFRVKTGPSGLCGLESSTHIIGNPHPSRNLGLQIQRGEIPLIGILEPKICNPLARMQLLYGTK